LRGRKSKPISLAEGDTRKRGAKKHAELAANQDHGDPQWPDPPESFTLKQKAFYFDIRDRLERLGYLDSSDSICGKFAALACDEAENTRSHQSMRTALAFLSNLGLAGGVSRRFRAEKQGNPTEDLMTLLSGPRTPKERVQ
jgi:hypothetical protein